MGGSSLPTAATPGYGWYNATNGSRWVACDCLIAWLPWFERVLLARGLIKSCIDPWQLTGGAKASGNTHSQGGAFDLLYQTSAAHVAVAREMGAPATWARTVAQGFTRAHTHGVLSGCPHNGPAAYQITAQRRGYNGLGQATSGPYAGMWGYGHKDEFPDPTTYRTWQQGIAWAQAEVKRLTASSSTPTPAPALEEDDMAMTPAERQALIDDIRDAILNADVPNHDANGDGKPDGSAAFRSYSVMANFRAADLQRQVASLRTELAGISAAMGALAKAQGADAAQIAALVDKAVRDRLAQVRIEVTDTTTA